MTCILLYYVLKKIDLQTEKFNLVQLYKAVITE